MRPAHARDGGSVLIMGLFYFLIAAALIAVIAVATAVHLERKKLLGYADQVALAAATAVDQGAYYHFASVDVGTVLITQASVDAAVAAFTAAAAAQGSQFADLSINAVTTNNRTVTVTAGATAQVPVLSTILAAWSGGIRLEVTTHANAR